MNIYTIPKLEKNQNSTDEWYHPTILHKHTDWEFTTIIDGKALNIVNGIPHATSFGTFILLGPNHLHEQQSDTPLVRRDICVSCHNFKKYCTEIHPNLYEVLHTMNEPIFIHIPPHTMHEINERLKSLDIYKHIDKEYACSILHSIISYLLGIYVESIYHTENKNTPPWLLVFLRKIQTPEYFSKKISELVGLSNYTHAHFLELFKQYTGQTLVEYITTLRMNYAAKMLLNTNLSIIAISNEIGYTNPSFFTQRFRSFFGVTPSYYRKQTPPPKQ